MARLTNPLGATSTTEAKKEKKGRKRGNANKQEKKYQRALPIVLCQHYEGHQLFRNAVVQISKENKSQAGTAVIGSSGQSQRCLH